ncbi:MAG: hypothetical protein F6K14_15675 [Symploca sp. SIO2C1]|nr:hypothetical protein [Symploca sp. SIO2C1]
MDDFNELIQGFQVADENERPPETSEELDNEHLEVEISAAFSQHRMINDALVTFLGFSAVGEGVLLFAQLGLPTLATGSIGSIALALFAANTLTKIAIANGRPSIDGDFWIEVVKTGAAGTALFVFSRESREISKASHKGAQQFIEEVKAFEVTEPVNPLWTKPAIALVTLIVLLIILVIFGRRS